MLLWVLEPNGYLHKHKDSRVSLLFKLQEAQGQVLSAF